MAAHENLHPGQFRETLNQREREEHDQYMTMVQQQQPHWDSQYGRRV